MKNLFITTVLALSIVVSSFASDETKVNSIAARNFFYEFTDAKNVNWTSTKNYLKVSFTSNERAMNAYYNLNGNYIGASCKVELADLPMYAKRYFARKYAGYIVKEAFRFDAANETAYFLAVENESQSIYLKVTVDGSVSIINRK